MTGNIVIITCMTNMWAYIVLITVTVDCNVNVNVNVLNILGLDIKYTHFQKYILLRITFDGTMLGGKYM